MAHECNLVSREGILEYIKKSAEAIGSESLLLSGTCFFDMLIRKRILYFLKLYEDADSLTMEISYYLRSLAALFKGESYVLALKSGHRALEERTVYLRQGMPVVTPDTFLSILQENMVFARKFKKKTFELDSEKLSKCRESMNLSYSDLSNFVSISKETLYCYEHGKCRALEENLNRLESFFGESLKVSYSSGQLELGSARKTKFFSLEFILSAKPFKMANRVGNSVVSISFMNDRRTAAKNAELLNCVRNISGELEPAFFRDSPRAETYHGIPVLNSEDMLSADSHSSLIKLIKEKRSDVGCRD